MINLKAGLQPCPEMERSKVLQPEHTSSPAAVTQCAKEGVTFEPGAVKSYQSGYWRGEQQ